MRKFKYNETVYHRILINVSSPKNLQFARFSCKSVLFCNKPNLHMYMFMVSIASYHYELKIYDIKNTYKFHYAEWSEDTNVHLTMLDNYTMLWL